MEAGQVYANEIWIKWIKTVLPELRRREKWQQCGRQIKLDDIVLLIDESADRNCYKKARVIGINPGRDGKVRSVSIQTEDGIYVRPITKLAILDVRKDGEQDKGIPEAMGIPGGSITAAANPDGRQLRRLPHRLM